MDGSDSPTTEPVNKIETISSVQQDVLFILFGTSGAISVLGASFLCYLIWNSTKSRALTPRQRILFGLSFFDFLGACRNCVTGYQDIHHKTTEPSPMCTLNGFVIFISYSTALYNMFLSLYYYLTIRGGVSQRTFELKYEKWCHAVAILYFLIPGIVGFPFQIYNPAGGDRSGCLPVPYPPDCSLQADVPCTRGQHAMVFLYGNLIALYFIAFPVIILTNILLYLHVRNLDMRSRRYSLTDDRAAKTRKVATQCFLYVFVFFLTWIWTSINFILNVTDSEVFEAGKYYALQVLGHLFNPLQGFGNLVVYLRPVYLQLRGSGCTRWEAFLRLLLNKNGSGPVNRQQAVASSLGAVSPSQGLSEHFPLFSRMFSQEFVIRDTNRKASKTVSMISSVDEVHQEAITIPDVNLTITNDPKAEQDTEISDDRNASRVAV